MMWISLGMKVPKLSAVRELMNQETDLQINILEVKVGLLPL